MWIPKQRIVIALLGVCAALSAANVSVAQGVADAGRPQGGAAAGFLNRKPLPPVVIPDSEYVVWPLTPAQAKYKDINGEHLKNDYVAQIVAISEKSKADGNQYWGRISSTPYDKMTREWVMAQLNRIGIQQVTDHPVDQKPMWFPTSWTASVTSGGNTIPIRTAFALGGESTPAGGIDLPIVWVGLGTSADFVGRDVKGKAVLIFDQPQPGRRENTALSLGAIERAKKSGAALIILDLALPGMPDAVTQPVTGGGGEDAVSDSRMISMSPGESDLVREMIGRGEQPMLHYELTVTRKGGPTGVITGVLPGTTDENILIEAHMDSFFDGAADNASGIAELLGLAEHYAKIPQAQRRRNLIFMLNSDHHSGSAGLVWVRENMGAQLDKTVIDFNCEHPSETQFYQISGGLMSANTVGAKRINLGGTNGTPLERDLIRNGFKSFGVAFYSRPDGGDGSGGNGFSNAPPRVGVIDHILYHTSMDTPEWVPAIGIERSAQAYASIIDEVNKLNMNQVRLPKEAQESQGGR